jgi:hypothetical protein
MIVCIPLYLYAGDMFHQIQFQEQNKKRFCFPVALNPSDFCIPFISRTNILDLPNRYDPPPLDLVPYVHTSSLAFSWLTHM